MARVGADQTSAHRQLTLDDWTQMMKVTGGLASEPGAEPEPVAALVDALAPRLAGRALQPNPFGRYSGCRGHRTAAHAR